MLRSASHAASLLMPAPCAGHDGIDVGELRGKAQHGSRSAGIGEQYRRITGAASGLGDRHLAPGDAFDRRDYFAHGDALARSEVDRARFALSEQMLESQ